MKVVVSRDSEPGRTSRVWTLAGGALALLVVVTLPVWLPSNFLLYLATQAGVYMIVALALN
ncbi:MAG TPA: hypothetical protein VFE63_17560, partial [Roseiarcus sp.]|nr:hypothetical protein [Roseiarcus sp.]